VIKFEVDYLDGKKEGKEFAFFKNGNKKFENNYENDKRTDLCI